MSRVLVFNDLHFPAVHKNALSFVKKIRDKYKCTRFVLNGDFVDNHYISSHPKNIEDENSSVSHYLKVLKQIDVWKKEFADVDVTIGNHDERIINLGAKQANIPRLYFKDYAQLYNTPKWNYVQDIVIDDVLYTHGSGSSSAPNPALNLAKSNGMSVCIGHFHSKAAINWVNLAGKKKVFGLTNGCLLDINHSVMSYAKNHLDKPILACSVVIDGHPYLELMP